MHMCNGIRQGPLVVRCGNDSSSRVLQICNNKNNNFIICVAHLSTTFASGNENPSANNSSLIANIFNEQKKIFKSQKERRRMKGLS